MATLKELRCPPDCPRRSSSCHSNCERYEIYSAEVARLRKLRQADSITITEAFHKKLNHYNKRFY